MMRRSVAAAYCDLTMKDFERAVIAGELPVPTRVAGQERWSRVLIDNALERISGDAIPDWRADCEFYKRHNAA